MAYNDQTEYPRGIFHTAVLSTTPLDVSTPSRAVRVSGIVLGGGAAAEIVIFRNTAGTGEIMRVHVPIATSVIINARFLAPDGLEVLTASTAGDVDVTIFYFDD